MSARAFLPVVLTVLTACGGGSSRAGDGSAALNAPAPVANQAPVADIRASSRVQEGSLTSLDGSGSLDQDGTIQRYRWVQLAGPPVRLTASDAPSTTFTAPGVDDAARLRFRLTVIDDDGASGMAQVTLTVQPARYSLSGTLVAAGGMAVDGDVNDAGAPRTPNDTPETAQRIANPVTLGGYAAEPGAGAAGSLQPGGDVSDFYRVRLRGGQSASLLVAEPESADLDLYLWNSAGDQVVDASTDTGDLEMVRVTRGGSYLLEVTAYRGASNYSLVIGHDRIPGIQSGLHLAADFVAGEIIVERRRSMAGVGFRAATTAADAPGADPVVTDGPMLLRLDDSARAMQQRPLHGTQRHEHRVDAADVANAEVRLKLDTLLAIKALRQDDAVRYAQPNYRVTTQAVPNDTFYPLQWHYPMIDLPSAWKLADGTGTTVAVLDTGVLAEHPDLAGQLVPGYDFVGSVAAAGDGDGIDPDPADPGPGEGGAPYHGTHVAGTVAAVGGNEEGTVGVAPGAKIMPVRVLSAVGGSSYDILQGVRYASGLSNDSGTLVAPVDVINLSLGREGRCWPAEQAAFDAAREAGVTIVAAAGNDAIDAGNAFPANCNNVVAAGAVGPDGARAPYSNFGSQVDVHAPGGLPGDSDGDGYRDGVLSLMGERQPSGSVLPSYAFRYGTSMASPHVAGIIALMRSVNPLLSPADVDQLVTSGELTDAHGVINAYRAVFAALAVAGNPPVGEPMPKVTPSSLNFGSAYNHAEIEVRAPRDERLETIPLANEGWLRVIAASEPAGPVRRFAVTVDRSGLATGTYTDVITFAQAGELLQVPVIMQVVAREGPADAGHLYVILVDSDSGDVVRQVKVTAAEGRYAYHFAEVAAGRYELIAGTDADNDGAICDAGESCGVYRNARGLEGLVVGRSVTDADFPVGRLISITDRSSRIGHEVLRSDGGIATKQVAP